MPDQKKSFQPVQSHKKSEISDAQPDSQKKFLNRHSGIEEFNQNRREHIHIQDENAARVEEEGDIKAEEEGKKGEVSECDCYQKYFENHKKMKFSGLTKKIVKLLKNSPFKTLDINKASLKLKVDSRLICYIATILQGPRFVERISKNVIRMSEKFEKKLKLQALDERKRRLEVKIIQLNSQISSSVRQQIP